MLEFDSLTAVSPIDGRYHRHTASLSGYFSEFALIKYRVIVEVEYFIALHSSGILPDLKPEEELSLRQIITQFSHEDGQKVKAVEKITNHDVKAVEYFLKEKLDDIGGELAQRKEFIHFGLTSQDINNTSFPMMLRDALTELFIPQWQTISDTLGGLVGNWQHIPMLARTHGQPASPTRLGKEIEVFKVRLDNQLSILKQLSFPGKFGGATGNFNAHFVAFPDKDWHLFASNFLQDKLGLQRSFPTTQIDHYDGLAQIFDCVKRINTLLKDLCIDSWLYISSDYFKQKVVANEVGSSAMPHKVNPIDFENAEGNFGISSTLLEFLSRELPVSRLQRDLTDSTVLRNVGVALAHSWIALKSLEKGIGKLELNESKLAQDLDNNWAVVSEGIQNILRREGYKNPYEKLKELTRGNSQINASSIQQFITSLEVSEEVKSELRSITPSTYTGR